jgi:polyferredoxin
MTVSGDSLQALRNIKLLHTVVWAIFVACILGISIASLLGRHALAAALAAIVLGEVLVLVVNGWRCPLTAVAARYTQDRRDNFDIYLPEWLARHNKTLCGAIYVMSLVYAGLRWIHMT